MAEDDLCASLRRIADTVETNGGWHIAALKVRAAADEIERLRAALLEAIGYVELDSETPYELTQWRIAAGLPAHEKSAEHGK